MNSTKRNHRENDQKDIPIVQKKEIQEDETQGNEAKMEGETLSERIFSNLSDMKENSEAKKIAEKIFHIDELSPMYEKYEKGFADMVARYVIKHIIDHEIAYGHYEYLHDTLLNHTYLNEQERKRIEKNIDKCALNYIKRHSLWILETEVQNESLYDFENLIKIVSTEYISEEPRRKAEKVLLKRVKNMKELWRWLLIVSKNDKVPEYIRKEADNTMRKQSQVWTRKYRKQEK